MSQRIQPKLPWKPHISTCFIQGHNLAFLISHPLAWTTVCHTLAKHHRKIAFFFFKYNSFFPASIPQNNTLETLRQGKQT